MRLQVVSGDIIFSRGFFVDALVVFIDWARKQITSYSDTFRRQVYSADVDPKVVEEAKKITFSQSRKVSLCYWGTCSSDIILLYQHLEDFGLDFRFLLEELLKEHPKETIDASKPLSFKQNHVVNPNPTPTLRTSASKGTIRLSPNPTPTKPSFSSATPEPDMPPPPIPPINRSRTPISADAPSPDVSTPRRPRTPTTPSRSNTNTRERPARGNRGPPPISSSASPAPPPRSTHRPGSSIAQRPPPVAVPQREGMF